MCELGALWVATLHFDNHTDLSIFPAFFNECKRVANNMDNILLVGVSLVYALNTCVIFNWLIDFPPLLESEDSRGESRVAATFYLLLFIVIPVFSSFLFTSEPALNESGLFELLPWKPLSRVRHPTRRQR